MKIYSLESLPASEYGAAGGKARGLTELIKAGLSVAPGFVIIGLETDADYINAAEYFEKSGLKTVAVRSSATNEDGADFSNAGQFSTFLNVEGTESFIAALKNCVKSLENETAGAYSKFFAFSDKKNSMSIVVQKMVDAAFAGVCFTADPVTRQKALMLEAVAGLGESLVSGAAAAERYIIEYDAGGALKSYTQKSSLIGDDMINTIASGAVRAVKYFGCELDLEWAVDKNGGLLWLQARPITTLDEAEIDEFDADVDSNAVVTNCNIGEMLPGAVTPLSLSTSVRAIDEGLRNMLIRAGAYTKKTLKSGDCIISYSNHLFFNLTVIYKMAATMIGASQRDVDVSICGKRLDTPPSHWKNKNGFARAINGIKYFSFILAAKKAKKRIVEVTDAIDIPYSEDLETFYSRIGSFLPHLDEATGLHYVTSSQSGAMSSALLMILSKEFDNESDAKSVVAGLLEDIDGIESVDILRSLRALGRAALDKNPASKDFTPKELLEFIFSDTGSVKAAYEYFIARHGHRAIREAEIRSKSWKSDVNALMENVLTVMQAGAYEPAKTVSHLQECRDRVLLGKKGLGKKAINYVVNQARAGVANREFTKSRFVLAVDKFKDAYKLLAADLVNAGALPDEDLIYFLTHEEIGALIIEKKAKLIKRAIQRRRLLEEQKLLKFKDVNLGNPKPIALNSLTAADGMILSGAPISRGEVRGVARVVKTVEDAKLLKDGEIMIASFTDIGWSPYYSVIGGLVTEVGSALSHGAVVAREYALPLVVNVSNATSIIRTGDVISLNGNKGVVTILSCRD